MVNDERLPSVRVEVEGLASTDLDAPEVDEQGGGPSSSALAGVVTLAVLIVVGATLFVLSSNGGAEPDTAQDGSLPEETTAEEFELAANGGDFHLSIAQSINAEQEAKRVVAQLIEPSLRAVEVQGAVLGLSRSGSEEPSRLPPLWDSDDGETWTEVEVLINDDGEPNDVLYSWETLFVDGPLKVLGARAEGEVSWFVSWTGAQWDRIDISAAPGLRLDRPVHTTFDSVAFLATEAAPLEARDCTNTEPAFFVVEFFTDGAAPLIRNEGNFVISQRLSGLFPAAPTDDFLMRVGAIDVQASFGELTPCAGELAEEQLSSWFRVLDLETGQVETWPIHDKLGFAQSADFEGSTLVGDTPMFAFSDAGSISLLNPETGEWTTITSPAFADVDVRTGFLATTSALRWYSIDYTTLIIVDLIEAGGTIETVETTATITMSEEGLRALDSAEVLWANLDTVIFATGDTSWIVNVPEAPISQAAGSQ